MNKLILIICLSFIFGETLTYNAKFNKISVGIATLEILNSNPASDLSVFMGIDNPGTKIINFDLQSKKFIDFILKLRESITMEVDPLDFSLIHINKKSQIKDDFNEYAISFNDSTKRIYDPISIIYFLRNQELKLNDEYTFEVYSSKNNKKITMKVSGEENVKFKTKTYNCFVLEPLKNSSGQIKLWIAKETGIPIIIEQDGKNGIITLKLKNIKNES